VHPATDRCKFASMPKGHRCHADPSVRATVPTPFYTEHLYHYTLTLNPH